MKKHFCVVACAVVILVFFLSGCAAKDPLVGKWEEKNSNYPGNLEFTDSKMISDDLNADGTWLRTEYNYKTDSGKLILTKGVWYPEYTYTEISGQSDIDYNLDGNILTLWNNRYFTKVDEFNKINTHVYK